MIPAATLQRYREQFEGSMGGGMGLELCDEVERLQTENAKLRAEIDGHRAFQRSVNEALNSGDGSYRP